MQNSKAFDRNSVEFQMFGDLWNMCKIYWEPVVLNADKSNRDAQDKFFQERHDACVALDKKYNDERLRQMMFGFMKAQDTMIKEKEFQIEQHKATCNSHVEEAIRTQNLDSLTPEEFRIVWKRLNDEFQSSPEMIAMFAGASEDQQRNLIYSYYIKKEDITTGKQESLELNEDEVFSR